MQSKARIKDIAEHSGVSPATVSRALNGSSLVAEPTLSRIRETARRLGYRPNVNARNLRTQRSMSVLMLVRDVGNPFYLEVFKGIEAAARDAGYVVLMGNTENDAEREAEYFNMLDDGRADGMILMTGTLPAPERLVSAASEQSVVVALEMIENSTFPHVIIDNERAAAEAVEHLISLGHRRIAHIAGPLPEEMSTRRLAGYRRAMQAAGLDMPAELVRTGDFSLKSGELQGQLLFEQSEPPTAIFAANDEMAFGAIQAMAARGLTVPEDVSVVGFDDLSLSKAFQPPLTTVSQPRIEIGRTAMLRLLDLIEQGETSQAVTVLGTELIIRGTTAPPRHN
ncbi:LacI family DNA-binding transcriptional regulator [Pseudohoeflea coraliihabitans]|uniref:LacI family transcriptional regulator n=1 Tax=Pseudohoeflea coraliihabitans TaxID=2860393 RepID=A0ABS6WNT0_9HYPH|nr:LacI family DNA-binding transcriptional regulator [Pseudohoeflea sp. DP4N28-3]MBW3097555.1 LacI family transcriptional regulator [Pseudohoeflea sp. DP4N28-3]